MKTQSQNGFTLVELLVVIAIIGMLSAALIAYMPGAIEAGRALKCSANLKNLAQAAASNIIASSGAVPTAGSFEWTTLDRSAENANGEPSQTLKYHCSGAWVSWTCGGDWPYTSDKSERDSMTASTFFDKSRTDPNSKALYSITNGVLWSLVGKDASVYLCETHKKVMERQIGGRVYRSYVMNRYFGFDDRDEADPNYRRWVYVESVSQSGTAALRLLFTELPGQLGKSSDTTSGKEDSVLDPEANEYPGFNHKIGKKWVAHVAFADGHVEGLVQPLGANATDLKDLTEHLCNGEEIDAIVRAKMQ